MHPQPGPLPPSPLRLADAGDAKPAWITQDASGLQAQPGVGAGDDGMRAK